MKKDRYRMEKDGERVFKIDKKNSRPNFGKLTSYFLVM